MPFGTSKQFGGDRFGAVGRFGAGRFGEAVQLTPYDMFRQGELGDFFDNSRLDLMWQDAAGTTPAVADGPVGKQIGVCGRIVRTQATAGNRLTLKYDSAAGRYYLSQEGVTTAHLVTATLDATAYDCVTVWAGIRKLSDAASACIMEFGTGSENGVFVLFGPLGAATNYNFRSKGTATAGPSATIAAPHTDVVTGIGRISTDTAIIRRNGLQVSQDSSNQGTGTYGNYAMYWFARGGASLPFSGREYCSGFRFSLTSSTERELRDMEKWITARTPIS